MEFIAYSHLSFQNVLLTKYTTFDKNICTTVSRDKGLYVGLTKHHAEERKEIFFRILIMIHTWHLLYSGIPGKNEKNFHLKIHFLSLIVQLKKMRTKPYCLRRRMSNKPNPDGDRLLRIKPLPILPLFHFLVLEKLTDLSLGTQHKWLVKRYRMTSYAWKTNNPRKSVYQRRHLDIPV